MALEPVTLIVVPGPGADVRRYRLRPRPLVRAVGGLVLLALLFATAAGLHLHFLGFKRGDNEALREQNRVIRAELGAMRERAALLGNTLDRVARVDQKLRGSTQLGSPGLAMGPTEDPLLSRDDAADEPAPVKRVIPEGAADMALTIEAMSRQAQQRENSLQELQAYFQEQKSLLAATPSIWPLHGAVTSAFGSRADPFNAEPSETHSGLDVAGQLGSMVVAPSDGTVVFAGLEGGYGNVVVIDHGQGIKTRYGHLSAFKVKPGDKVRRGQQIAAVGTTGRSTGPHLHYEVRVNGVAQNPRKFILEE